MALTKISTAGVKDDIVTSAKIADDAVGAEHIEQLDDHLHFADSKKAQFGAKAGGGGDLEIYHNGSESYIDHIGTGSLYIRDQQNSGVVAIQADSIQLLTGTVNPTETYLTCSLNAEVELYYNNVKKFETTSSGVKTVGNVVAMPGDISCVSDSNKITAGLGDDIQIYHDGSDSVINNITGNLYINAKASETALKIVPDGTVELYHNNVKKFETTSSGVKVTGIIDAQDDVYIKDAEKLILGDDDDLQISYTSGHSLIKHTTSGYLRLLAGGSGVTISNVDNTETMATFLKDGAVELYHNNVKKFETAATGVYIRASGASGFWIDNQDDAGKDIEFIANGDKLRFNDSVKATFGNIDDCQIFHDGTNTMIDNDTGDLKISSTGALRLRGDQVSLQDHAQTEAYVHCVKNSAVDLYYDNVKKFGTTGHGASIYDDELRIGTNSGSGSDCLIRLGSHGTDTDTHAVIAYDTSNNRLSMIVSGESHGSAGLQVQNGGSVNSASFGPHADNTYNMGATLNRWSTIYAQNALNTSDRNLKNTIKTSDLGLSFINQLNPVSYKFNLYEGQVQDTRTHYGLIAQEVEDVIKKEGKTIDDFAAIVAEEGRYNLAYNEMISPLIKAVQELSAKVAALEAK